MYRGISFCVRCPLLLFVIVNVGDAVAVVVAVGGFVLAVNVGVGMTVAVLVGMDDVAVAVFVDMDVLVLVVML